MTEFDKQEPIAIIGAACRLPGEVSSLGSLWDMISHARTGHCKIPADRWDADLLQHPDPDRKGTVRGAANQNGSLLIRLTDGCQARLLPPARRQPF
jgi:acyl transferase domain-containing protein